MYAIICLTICELETKVHFTYFEISSVSAVALPLIYTLDFFLTFVFQFTEEKLGQAEKTELDPHLDNLITRADGTKNWTEKILRQTEVLLQPNPSKKKMENKGITWKDMWTPN